MLINSAKTTGNCMSTVFLQVAEKLQGNKTIFMQSKSNPAQNNSEEVSKGKAMTKVAHHIRCSYVYILMEAYPEWLSKLLMPGQPL